MANFAGFLKFAAAVITLFQLSNADTPANCMYEDIKGSWIFSETQSRGDNSVNCTVLGPIVRQLYVDLDYPNVAVDQNGNLGHWTLVYNQGFEVTINQRKYFAFSYYEQVGDNVTSYCDRTFNGWSHDVLVRNWACYSAKKVDAVEPRVRYEPAINHLLTGEFHNDKDLIKAINKLQKSWTARPYAQFEGLSQEDMLKMKGGRASRVISRPKPAPIVADVERAASLLPDEIDWRNVDGVNFVSDVRDQEGCGSCYAFASMGQIESRLRVITNNSVNVVLSPQDIVECSEYSQGCEGGFPYLIAGKYGQDFGAVDEECNPYVGMDGKCSTKPCGRHYVSFYQYVGGYYGGCNEALMRLALVNGGPIAVGFEVYDDFFQYSGGIYKHTSINYGYDPFEVVNHAVLVVGYGADSTTGEKFWIVKNSWGAAWGENGYFRISRGNDECGIESLAVEIIPIPY